MPLTQFNQTPLGTDTLLFRLIGANMNSTADQTFVPVQPFTNYVITSIVATNASTSLTLAVGGIYQSVSKAGTPIVAATQVYSGLTTTSKVVNPTVNLTDVQTVTPILSLTVAQGSTATADLRIYGYILS
jgi:hypothetical protein